MIGMSTKGEWLPCRRNGAATIDRPRLYFMFLYVHGGMNRQALLANFARGWGQWPLIGVSRYAVPIVLPKAGHWGAALTRVLYNE